MKKQHTVDFSDFNSQFETLLREQRAACRAAALSALDRVFPAEICTSASDSRASRRSRKVSRRRNRTSGKTPPRRTPAEMANLGERLFKAICAKPGQPRATLAGQLEVSPSELDRPMNHFRSSGRVRTVGQRHLTRYFPAFVDAVEQQETQTGGHAKTSASNNDGQVAPVRALRRPILVHAA